MSYTSFDAMCKSIYERFHLDCGPQQPPFYQNPENPNDLKSAALRFIRKRCEQLNFDPTVAARETENGELLGKSLKTGQIPYNMEMDINRLCLEKALEAFIDSGTAEDAYPVYYCYLEMFMGRYGNSKRMVELLSEYEANGSSLLMKHRDHYSHSVYVFALGLAIYETNEAFREKFRKYYDLEKRAANEVANIFLEFWGLTSLFHDIGYPFELPFEQVISYFEIDNQKRGSESLYLSYHNIEALIKLGEPLSFHLEELYGKHFESTDELLSFDITQKLGKGYDFSEEYLLDVLKDKPTRPDRFGYFMDHAFFSAARLLHEIAAELSSEHVTKMHIDALSAILLHNSLYKFSIAFYKDGEKSKLPLKTEQFPLAWLLMLCDELQCWDRTAYGRNSRTELHPMAVDFDFSGNRLNAVYYYDIEEQDKINDFREKYRKWEESGEEGDTPRLKAYSDMAEKEQRFTRDIEKIVDTSIIPLNILPDMCTVDHSSKHIYLSGSNFLHLYDFAVAIHGRNMPAGTTAEELERKFSSQSLEYQLSGINRAKSFSRYLNAIGCFYTDRAVDYEMISSFTPEETAVIAPLEHERWVRDHISMGWLFGTEYEEIAENEKDDSLKGKLREQMRHHKLTMNGDVTSEEIHAHYLTLSEEEQDKDWRPFTSMLRLLKKFDGLRIYRL